MVANDKVVSLFSGAGGMSLGFSEAGLAPVLAADHNADACATYARNQGTEPELVDLGRRNDHLNRRLKELYGAFVLIGGPPCQGFSSAGTKNARDSRNRLIYEFLSIVETLAPRWFLFENVEGLLTSNGGASIRDLVSEFVRIGYRVRLEKVNFASFGLPQTRKRVVIVGNRIGLDFEFPRATHSFDSGKHRSGTGLPASPSVREALAGLGVPASRWDHTTTYTAINAQSEYDATMREGNTDCNVSCHVAVVKAEAEEMFRLLPPGGTMKDLPTDYWHESFKRRAFRRVKDGTPSEKRGGAPSGVKRLRGDLNSLTITGASTREFIHPDENRPLTIRECARLQSFPDRFQFCGSPASVAQQIGNAFPPMAARVFADHIMKLDGLMGAGSSVLPPETRGALLGYRLTDSSGMSPALSATDQLLRRLVETPQLSLPIGEHVGGVS